MRNLLNIFASLFLLISIVIAGDVLLGFLGFHKTDNLIMGEVLTQTAGAETGNFVSPVELKTSAVVPSVLAATTAVTPITTASILKSFSWEEISTKLRALPDFYFSEDVQFYKDANISGSAFIENNLEVGEKLKVHDDAKIKGNLTVEGEKISINGEKYIFPDEQGVGSLTNDGEGNLSWASIANSITTFLGLSDTPNSYSSNEDKIVRVNTAGTALEFVDLSSLGGVTSVTNSDGTLLISPTTGDVIASLNLGNANSWSAAQTFSSNTYFSDSSAISSSGNLGIGTTAPSSKLTLVGGDYLHNASGSLSLTGTYTAPGNTEDVYVQGRYAYLASDSNGFYIVDINNPAAPALVSNINTAGVAYGVYVSGRYLYVADGTAGLLIYDVTNPNSPVRVGLYNTSGQARKVTVSGNYAYVADYTGGLDVIDVTNPRNPTLVSATSTTLALDVYVAGRYLYLADGSNGLVTYDITNPASPSLVSTQAMSGTARDIYVSGKYAYVAASDISAALRIFDISNPSSPSATGSVSISQPLGVVVSGRYAYVADGTGGGGMRVVDISNPTAPVIAASYVSATFGATSVYVSGKYAYLADNDTGLEIVGINGDDTPAVTTGNLSSGNITVLDSADIGNNLNIRNSVNVGGRANFSGMVAIGVSSPQTALTIAQSSTGDLLNLLNNSTSLFIVKGNGRVGIGTTAPESLLSLAGGATIGAGYTGIGISAPLNGLLVQGNVGLGTTNPSEKLNLVGGNFLHKASGDPELIATVSNVAQDVVVVGKYAYIADQNQTAALRILDISNPSSPSQVGSANIGGFNQADEVFVSGSYAYLAALSNGTKIIDISNPSSPTVVASIAAGSSVRGVFVQGNYLYTIDSGVVGDALKIYDITVPTSPRLAGSYGSVLYGVYVSGKYAYLAQHSGGMLIVDISDPSSPSLVGTYDTPGAALKITVVGKYAYIADLDGGLQIVNISNPASPVSAGSYATTDSAYDVKVAGNYAYIAENGTNNYFEIIDISNPASPVLVSTVGTTESYGIDVAGKYAYIADRSAGTKIYDINGVDTPSLVAGAVETTDLNVTNNLSVDNYLLANSLGIGRGGAKIEGTVGIGTSSSQSALTVSQRGSGFIFNVLDGNTSVFTVEDGGNVGIGTSDPGSKLSIANLGTGTGTTLVIDSSGNVFKDSSSERYKMNIEPLNVDFEKVLELQPKEYDFKDSGIHTIGYIAEEVEALGGLDDLLIYDNQGRVDGFKYDRLPIYTLEIVKGLNERVESLEERVSNLESKAGVLGDSDDATDSEGVADESVSDYYGIIVVDEDGDVEIENNVEVRGLLRAAKINISENSEAVGKAVIRAGQTSVEVGSATLTVDSVIFVTPDSPVTISAKKTDYDKFEVKLDKSYDYDVNVNWIVIN